MHVVTGIEILSDEIVGRGGFLAIRRLRCVNRRADGTRSAEYVCDYLVRPKGIDAVVVAVWTREGGPVRVLIRGQLRLPLIVGRSGPLPVPDDKTYLFFSEVVAGIVEVGDSGAAGIRERAAIEVEEEAGITVRADDLVLLGAGTFPSPGAMAEKFWLLAVQVPSTEQHAPAGDGSPMEEGSSMEWVELDEAIARCVRGEIEDAKTELILRRLRDHLAPFEGV